MAACTHVPDDVTPPRISATGCETCLETGRSDWIHLRFCQTCGRVGCCDSSPGKHATAHHRETGHPLARSFEPGENWWWCFVDRTAFEVEGAPEASYA